MLMNKLNYMEFLVYTGGASPETMKNEIIRVCDDIRDLVLLLEGKELLTHTAATMVINDVLFGLVEFMHACGDPEVYEMTRYTSLDIVEIMNDIMMIEGIIRRLDREMNKIKESYTVDDAAQICNLLMVMKDKLWLCIDEIGDVMLCKK